MKSNKEDITVSFHSSSPFTSLLLLLAMLVTGGYLSPVRADFNNRHEVKFSPKQGAAGQKGDWRAVTNSINQEIAVETLDGKSAFGILRSADDGEIKIQIADRKRLTSQETIIRRGEITKVWRASLRYGGRRTGRGALIGAGIGAGVGSALAITHEDDGYAALGIIVYATLGTISGAVVGFFSKKEHKKTQLLYSV